MEETLRYASGEQGRSVVGGAGAGGGVGKWEAGQKVCRELVSEGAAAWLPRSRQQGNQRPEVASINRMRGLPKLLVFQVLSTSES